MPGKQSGKQWWERSQWCAVRALDANPSGPCFIGKGGTQRVIDRLYHKGLSLIRSGFMNWFWQKPIWFVNQIQFDRPNVYLMWNVYWQTFTLNLIVNYMVSAPINLLFTSKQIMIYLKNTYKFSSDLSIFFFDIVHKK